MMLSSGGSLYTWRQMPPMPPFVWFSFVGGGEKTRSFVWCQRSRTRRVFQGYWGNSLSSFPPNPLHLSRTGRGADIFPQMSLVHVSHTLSHIRACPLSTTNLSTHARWPLGCWPSARQLPEATINGIPDMDTGVHGGVHDWEFHLHPSLHCYSVLFCRHVTWVNTGRMSGSGVDGGAKSSSAVARVNRCWPEDRKVLVWVHLGCLPWQDTYWPSGAFPGVLPLSFPFYLPFLFWSYCKMLAR